MTPRRPLCHALGTAARLIMLVGALALPGNLVHAQAEESAFDQLEQLLEAAPNRQIGQPGNDVIDRQIQQAFADAVARQNDPARWAQAQQLVADADGAEAALAQKLADLQLILSAESESFISPWWIRLTLEHPWQATIGLCVLLVIVLISWRIQRRGDLLVAAAVVVALALLLPALAWLVETDVERARQQEGVELHTTGGLTRGRDAAGRAALLADQRANEALTGLWQHGRIVFPTAAFLPGHAALTTSDGREVALYQLAPNLVEPGNLPAAGFAGSLVYIGAGRPDQVAGKQLTGAAVLVEFNSARRWIDAVALGAEVVIVLEPATGDSASFSEAVQKLSATPLSVPRFYLQRSELEASFGNDWQEKLGTGGETVSISQQPGRWQRREAATDWLFIPGPKAAYDRNQPRLVHIQAYKDAASLVPEISPGAQSAANIVLLQRLLDRFEKQPPQRPVLLSVVNDHTNALNGENIYAFTCFTEPEALLKEIESLDRDLAVQRFISKLYAQVPGAELLEHMRYQVERVGGKVLTVTKPAVEELSSRRNRTMQQRRRVQFRISEPGDRPLTDEQRRTEIERLEQQAEGYIPLMQLFNRLGSKSYYRDLSTVQRGQLAKLFADIAAQAELEADQLARARLIWHESLAIRRRLMHLTGADEGLDVTEADYETVFKRRYGPLPAVAAISLDLAFGSDKAGFFFGYDPVDEWDVQRVQRLASHALTVADDYARQTGKPSRLADAIRNTGGLPAQAYLGARFDLGARAVHQFALPGLTLTSVRDARSLAFTPHDTIDRIDRRRFDTLMSFAEGYLPLLVDAPGLEATVQQRGTAWSVTAEIILRKQDDQAIGLPRLVIADGLVTTYKPRATELELMYSGQVRRLPILMTDARGSVRLRGAYWNTTSLMAFGFDPEFRQLNAALDFGEGERRFISTVTVDTTGFRTNNIVAFDARKVDLLGLTGPLTLRPVLELDVLDASQNSQPRHFSVAGVKSIASGKLVQPSLDRTGAVFMEPGSRFKLLIEGGPVINADAETPDGRGFPAETGRVRNVALTAARDMWQLNQSRLDLLSSKGVSSSAPDSFNDDARLKLDAVDSATQDHQFGRVQHAAEEARGMAFRGYKLTLSIINDLITAVVVFLGMVIPFCFFTMKLITPWQTVNRQLALFGGVFVVMAIILQLVHPAFGVASTPQVVVLAFVILGLAIFVGSTILSRFNASMTQAVEQSQMSAAVDAPQSRLLGTAFMVGVNNMKRRRIRTALTALTIVLVTFTLLSVMSVGQGTEPTQLRLQDTAPYDGFLFTRPGLGPINPIQMSQLRAHFDGRATTAARAWVQRQGPFGGYLPYQLRLVDPSANQAAATSTTLQAKVLLGMDVAENGQVGDLPLTPASRWFSANNATEVILSVKAAAVLGIGPDNFAGRQIWLKGNRFELVGLIEDEAFAQMRDLGDVPLLPLLSKSSADQQAKNAALQLAEGEAAGTASLDAGGDIMSDPNIEPARPIDVAIIPAETALTMDEAQFRMLSVKYSEPGQAADKAEAAWNQAQELIDYQHLRLSVGLTVAIEPEDRATPLAAGQYALASSSSTEVSGILKVAIPVALGATIILNTMLASVMERRREIGIYNAIGLNPTHVMTFFLAESLVFGLVGSVAGYLIGQILSVLIGRFDLIDLNLNYSSLSVLLVIAISIVTVLLSTVYPASMAARAAVPSGQRRWALPQPEGDQIRVTFPFIYDPGRVLGVCAYLDALMKQNTEASTGKFLARPGPLGTVPATNGVEHKVFAMLYDVAPAPFDLGVNQTMEVYAFFNERLGAYMLEVVLERTSGEKGNWLTVNQPFLEATRKRLLGWRSQKTEIQQAFYEQGQELFADAIELPTAPSAVKDV